MPSPRGTGSAVRVPGALSGTAGLLVFLVLHHVWIVPIWFVAPIGWPIAVAGGMAVAWAYRELRPHLPARPWASLGWFALVAACLLPSVVLAEAREPMFELSGPGGATLLMSPARAAGVFVLELLVTTTLVGWCLGRTRRSAGAMAVAAFAFALGPGHNIPFGGGTAAVPLEIAIMAAVAAVSTIVLVEAHARLAPPSPQPRSAIGTKVRPVGPS